MGASATRRIWKLKHSGKFIGVVWLGGTLQIVVVFLRKRISLCHRHIHQYLKSGNSIAEEALKNAQEELNQSIPELNIS